MTRLLAGQKMVLNQVLHGMMFLMIGCALNVVLEKMILI
jgi:hypothetical protein